MPKFLLSILFLLAAIYSYAQEQRCGQQLLENQLRAENPALDSLMRVHDELKALENIISSQAGRAETIVIPVVFHVIHLNGEENIGDDQIHSAIRILNQDFNAINEELDEVISAFQSIIGDAEIEFRLASKDPDGNPTNGIDRIESSETNTGDDGAKLNPWPRDKYFNIWTTANITVTGTNASAYAYRPDAADPMPGVDGVIANHIYVGDIGTAVASGTKTLTHETGHYLDLPHPWGETNFPGCDGTATNPNDPCFGVNNCNFDDGIGDTPNTLGVSNGGCNLSQNTCSSLDNVQNFMDYANCEAMFTAGQVNRMRSTMNSSVADRSNLWTSSTHASTGVVDLFEARYYVERSTVCRGETIQFFDESRYEPESWSWVITGPVTLTSEEQNPSFTFLTPGIYSVELTVTQGSTTETINDENAFGVTDVIGHAVPFVEDFQDGGAKWAIDHNESYSKYQWEFNDDYGFDDESSFMVYNIGNDSKNHDDLLLAGVDFRPLNNISISFEVAYAKLNNSDNDKLSLAISNDCGVTWKSIWSGTANEMNDGKPLSSGILRPEADDWVSFTINNVPKAWTSENALLRFRFQPGGGNQLYLDNINIDGDYSVVPYLVYPYDGAPSVGDNVMLDWRAVPGCDSYEYQVSTDASFGSTVASGTIDALGGGSDEEDTQFQTSGLSLGTTHHWRVRSKTGGTSSEWSDAWSFTVANNGVGVEDQHAQVARLFPNPTSDLLNILVGSDLNHVEVEVFNINGQLVHTRNYASITSAKVISISTAAFPDGSYILRLKSEEKTENYRFLVNH